MTSQYVRDIDSINLAILLARHTLRDKVDKQGEPLIRHVARVVDRLRSKKSFTVEQLISVHLHECIEEGGLSESTVSEIFGDDVSWILIYLTRYKGETYFEYISKMITDCPSALLPKLCDLEDNLDESRGPIEESLRGRYLKAKQMIEEAIQSGSEEEISDSTIQKET